MFLVHMTYILPEVVFESSQLFQHWKSAHKTLNITDVFGIVFVFDNQACPLVTNNSEPVFVDKRNGFEQLILIQINKQIF